MPQPLFVVGLDPLNHGHLRRIDGYDRLCVKPALAYDEVKGRDAFDFDALVETACARIRAAGGAGGIVGWWDFPTTSLVPVLCRAFGLPGPSLTSVLTCEHKVWSRQLQREVAPECVPAFRAVDPFADPDPPLPYPFWLKPVKGFASQLSFRIAGPADFETALAATRERIDRLGTPFDALLRRVEMPADVAHVTGRWCIAEAAVGGRQCTLEGYVHRGVPRVYGVVDSIRHRNRSSFRRYQYPSRLPTAVQRRMIRVAERVMRHIGYDEATFNVEFFWEKASNKLWLLEINPRLSQSHADLFAEVHGVPHFQIMVDLALGRTPDWPSRVGPANCAAKFFIRRFRDGRVTRVPDQATLDAIKADYPDAIVDVRVQPGVVLSELHDQDAYSYELADVFLGAHDQHALLAAFQDIKRRLRFGFAPATRRGETPPPATAGQAV
ncbi:ATP-grasp domain-containing protein [Limimonas halophila]|uniref:ATP-grasp domain-containing protein n=1 Tax=Limimonas halophila TaxID=1082479 RepID=A0A1G7QMQ4_9PROT|nr:ATP-grasp domain-containing protein [Limimonas halophila]SDF99827.1 ATP-grasp domain-containing protein [Limimonas halophila]